MLNGQTDLLFITDAICRIPADVQDRFVQWKEQAQARLIALVIQSEPGDLLTISDEVHQVPSLDVSEAAVERVLSI